MSQMFENAIASIVLGVEDFETGSDARMLSAARNYYAGLLLLAKECLVRAAPEAEAFEVIGTNFKPVSDGSGGVEYKPEGYKTVDLQQIQQRFKDFGLSWPKVDIKKLQRLRNDLEHHHLKEPVSALSEAIASSFPMIVDFLNILEEQPQEHLSQVWGTILEQKEAFEKVKQACLKSFEPVDWPAPVANLDRMSCPLCGSSLIGQTDPDNTDHEHIEGKCHQCGEDLHFEKMMELVVAASYEVDAYIAAKEGLNSSIADCPECGTAAYVETGEVSICFACGESVAGECVRCSTPIDVHEYNYEHPELCSYCAHMLDKVMRE